jgi:uncharacterized protein (UPF0548 family)
VTLIDIFVVLGVAVVLPLALGGSFWAWPTVAAAVASSFLLDRGAGAAVLVLPFACLTAWCLIATLLRAGPLLFWTLRDVAQAVACGWALVAAGALVVSRLGWTPLGQREPVIELTTVHYIYAGAAALALAASTRRPLAVALTASAPPIVALGFLTGSAIPQVGGAVLMALGVWTTATLQLREALQPTRRFGQRALLAASGVAIWAPMVLAVAWAAGQHWSLPVLSIPDMARTHGTANASGFVLCGLLARRAERRDSAIAEKLDIARHQHVTYDAVGRTLTDRSLPSYARVLGTRPAAFDEAVRRLRAWAPQRHLGARVIPAEQAPDLGATIAVELRVGPIAVVVPNRVVAVVDEPNRWGFAYGTLPGHHERGEECFVITQDVDGTVTARITVDAEPASVPARLAAPLVRTLQRYAIRRYLDALA